MTKILFVCHGNICRSPLAEFIMKESVAKKGLSDEFYISSSAVSTEEIGNGVYPPVKRLLEKRGTDVSAKRARQVKKSDYTDFDYIVCMDKSNLRGIKKIVGEDVQNKISLLLDFTSHPADVADPWYTRDFEAALRDIERGCDALLDHILRAKN